MSTHRIQRMLDDRELEEMPAPDEEVAEFWRKALRSFNDARIAALSPEGAFTLAYQASLSAATAMLRCAGYRVRSRTRHHYVTFYVAEALASGTELADLAAELESFRFDRHATSYGPGLDEERMREQLDELRTLLGRFLPLARSWLAARRSTLDLPAVT